MATIWRNLCLGLLCAGTLFTGACVSSRPQPASGASNERYWLGTYSATFNTSLFQMDKAIRAACKRARLIEMQRVNKASSCLYLYKDIDTVKIRIEAVEKSGDNIKITIHVGQTGCKISSQQLLLAIDEELRIQANSQL